MNPSLALQKQGGYFLPTLSDECVRHTCWQTSFSVYKYQSTCSHSNGNQARLPAADEAQFHQLIAAGETAPWVLLYIWLYSAMNFSIQCPFTVVASRTHLKGKLCSNATHVSGTKCCIYWQFFCLFVFSDALKSTGNPMYSCVSSLSFLWEKKKVSDERILFVGIHWKHAPIFTTVIPFIY